jgi:hypothetical protein
MRFGANVRVRLAVLLVSAFVLFSSVQLPVKRLRHGTVARDYNAISDAERRYADLRRFLPRSGVFGYVTCRAGAGGYDPFFVAQYALAPLVIVDSRDCDWVIQDFGPDSPSPPPMPGDGFVLVAQDSGGVRLIRRVPP